MALFSFPFDEDQRAGNPVSAPLPGSFESAADSLRQFGLASTPQEGDPFVREPNTITLADGRKVTADHLLQAGEAGAKLYETATRIQNGKAYGFLDAFTEAPLASYFPFFGMFASVGKSISDAKDARNFFEKSLRGEATTEDEAIKATLFMNENHLRSEGGLGYAVGSIVQMMPSLFAEMSALGAVGGVARSAIAERAVADAGTSAGAAANLAFTKAYRSAVRASADDVVSKTLAAGMTAPELLASKAAFGDAVAQTARLSRGAYDAGYNAVAGFAPKWAPGLLGKAIMHEADAAVRRAIALKSTDGRMARFWAGLRESAADAARSGLYDLGSWGTDAATVTTGANSSWRRAALDGLTELTVGAASRGAALFLPRQAVVSGVGALAGAVPRSELGLMQAAWQNDDADLMESSWWRGLGADFLEYVSEQTGRGFNSLFRAAGMRVFPRAFAAAKGVVGNPGSAVLAKDASGAVTGVQYVGLVDPSQYSKVGGRLRQIVAERYGAKAMSEKVDADRFRAVEWMLGEKKIPVGNSAALQMTIASGKVQPGLSAAVAEEIGQDVAGYVRNAVKAANKAGIEGRKLEGYMMFTLADTLARKNIDPVRAWDWFQKVGYDGVVGEMLEERYNDVAQALFGFDANSDRSFAGRLKAAWDAMFPGRQQFLAELIGFSVPMLARGGIMRGIAALGGQNAFEKRVEWASLFNEASKFNVPVEVAPYGAYLRKADEQTARLSAHADELAERATAARAEGRRAEAVQLESETERYKAAAKRSADVKAAFSDSLTQGQLAEMASAQERAAEIRGRAAERTAEAERLEGAGDAEAAARAREQAAGLEALAQRTADGPALAVPMPSDELLASSESEYASRALPGTEEVARRQLSAAQLFVKGFADYAQGSYKLENRTDDESRGWFRRASRWVGEAALRLSGVAATGDVGFLSVNPAEWHAEDEGVPGGLLDEGKKIYAGAYASALNRLQSEATSAHLAEGGEATVPARASSEEAHRIALEMARPVLEETATRWLALKQVRMFAAEDLRDFALEDVAAKAGYVVDPEKGVVRDPRVGAESEKPLDTFASEHSDEIEAAVAHDAELLYTALTQGEGADRRRVNWEMSDPSRAVRAVLAIPAQSPTADKAVAAQATADAARFARMASAQGLPALRNMTDLAKDVTGDRTAREELEGTASRREFVDVLAKTLLPDGARFESRADFDEAVKRVRDADPALVATVARDLGFNVYLDGTAEGVEARDYAVARHVLQESLSHDPDRALYAKPVLDPTEEQKRLGAAREMVDVAVREPSGRWRLFPHTDDMRQSKDPVYASSLEEMDRILSDPRFGYSRASERIVYGPVRELRSDDPVAMIKTLGIGGEYMHRSRMAAGDDENCLDPALRHDPATGELLDEERAEEVRREELALNEMFEAAHGQGAEAYLQPGESKSDEAAMARAEVLRQRAKAANHRLYGRHSDTGAAVGYRAVADDLLRQRGVQVPGRGIAGQASSAFRGKYVMPARLVPLSGASGDYYVPIDHQTAQSYESALLDSICYRSFARSRGFLNGSLSRFLADSLEQFDRVMASVRDSLRGSDPDRAELVEDLRQATVARPPDGSVRTITPQTFAMFTSAFLLNRTEFPAKRLLSELGPHAAALAAVAPSIRQSAGYLGFLGVADRVLGGDGFELDQVTARKDDRESAPRGLRRLWAAFSPSEGTLFDSAKAALPANATRDDFARKVAGLLHAAVNPGAAVKNTTPPSVHAGLDVGPEVERSDLRVREIPADSPVAALVAVQSAMASVDGLTQSVFDDWVRGHAAMSTDKGGAAWTEIPEDYESRVESAPGVYLVETDPATVPGYAPSEEKEIVDVVATLCGLMRGAQRIPSQREFRDMVRLLAPGVREADWKSMWKRFNEARQEPDVAREWTWEPEEEVDEGIMPDGYEGTNSRAVAMLRSAAMRRLCALASLTSPMTGRDVQPFLDDVRSTLNQYRQLAPEMKGTAGQQAALADALQYLSWILEPHMQEAAGGAAEREAVFHARLAVMDTERGREIVSAHIRALLAPVDAVVDAEGADEYTIVRAPRFARAAVLLAYLMRLSARPETRGLRDQVASVLSNASPSDPARLGLSFTQPTDGSDPEPVFLMAPARGKTGSVSMTAVAGSFSRLVNMTADDVYNLRKHLSDEFQTAAERGDFDMASKKHLWTTGGTGIMNAYAKIVASVFGVDCPLVSALSSRSMFAKIRYEHAMSEKAAERERKAAEAEKRKPRPPRESLFSRLAGRFGYAKARGLPLAAKELLDVLDDVTKAVGARGEAARATLADVEGATASVFVNGPRLQSVRGLDAPINSLHGSSEWMQLMQAYADARPVSVMSAETDPERTSRPASSLAITMVGREPALSMFLDRKGEGGLLDVAKKWFGWGRLSDETAAKRLADLRQRLVWPDEAGTHIVAKSISKSAYADEVVEGCRTAFRAEIDPKYAEEAFGDRFVPRNLVYVPVFSGDHASAILVQVPLAKEFAKAGMDWDGAAEMVSSWLGLDLLGVDPKRSALTCAEAPACSMTGVRVNAETGEAETDDNGNVIRGRHTMGVVWNSDPEADNEAFIGGAYVYGYGAARQLAMSKDPRASTTKFHLMSSSDDETYGPSFTFGKALFISQAEENPASGQFLADTPAKMLIDLAHSIVGDPTMDSVTLTDKDSVKLALVSNKTVGPDLGDGKPGKLLDLILKKVDEHVKAGNAMPDGGFDAKAIDDIVGKVKWLDLTGRRERESELAVSQILKDARVVEVKRNGEGYDGRMFALTWRQDNVMAYSAANVSHPAKVADGPLARNYVADSLAVAEVMPTWSANTDDPGLFADPSSDADALRDLVGAYSLAGASLAQDEASVRRVLAQDEEYQKALDAHSGLVPGGPLDRQYVRRAYATWARKRLASMPVEGIDAPLVPNGSWIGKDGRAHSHVNTPWFVDTLQGARTVAKADRAFTRANKRVALCNVNCRTKGFRHGLYVDAAKLEEKFGASLGATEETGFKRTTLLLEHAVTLAQDPIGAGQNAMAEDVRRSLAECLYDHRGTYLSERKWDETVEYTDREGNKKTRTVHHEAALETSYRDLFTHANQRFDERAGLRPLFDRAAVYEGMHDADGNVTAYLGGTMFGLPRTPSYNGSMWLQVVRAGLPVTEAVDEKSGMWTDGYEAMVSPDPYTLKILGCDHDGDKAKLYMLGFQTATSLRDVASELTEGQDALLGGGDPAAYNASLVSRGLAQYGRDGGLEFSPAVRRAVSDSFVQLMFDFNRMLPVMSEDGGVPLSTGELRDGGAEHGSPYGWTKTKLAPEYEGNESRVRDVAAWERVLDSADSVTLDAKSGKLLRVPSVAASVQTGAARASAARGVVVALNRALHLAYASGLPVGPFARLSRDGRDWIDFMYHLDGLANMTFDDLKEQICGRLGVTPNMVDVIVADMLAEAAGGRLPHTDEQFVRAFAKYAAAAKLEGSSRWLMKKASDPADYRFRIAAFREVCGYAPGIAQYGGKPPAPDRAAVRAYAGYGGEVNSNWDKTARPADGTALQLVYDALQDDGAAWAVDDVPAMWSSACSLLVRGAARPKSPGLGALLWLGRLAGKSQYSSLSDADRAEVRSVVTCAFGLQALSDAKDFRNMVDFASVDPAEATATMDAGDARTDWANLVKDLGPDEQPRDFVRRMHMARYLLGRGPGETYAGWGSSCAAEHERLVDGIVRSWGSDGGSLAAEAELVTALASAPAIAWNDTMALERAAQTTPYALAAFLTLPSVAKSPLNAGNAWYVLESAARGMRGQGHPAGSANLTLSARRFIEAAVETMGRLVTSDRRGIPTGLGLFDLVRAVPDAGGFQFTPSLYGEGAAGLSRLSLSMGSVTADQLDAARSLVAQAVNGDLDGRGYALNSKTLAKLAGHPSVSGAAMRAVGGDAAARRGSASNVGADVNALKDAFASLDASEGEGFSLEPSAVFGQLLPLYAAMTTPFTGPVDESTHSILALFPEYADMWEAKVREMRETMPDLLDAVLPVDFSMAVFKPGAAKTPDGDVYEVSAEEQMAAAPSVGKTQEKLGLRAGGAAKARKAEAADGGASAVQSGVRKSGALAGVPSRLANPRFRGTLALFDDVRGLLFARALDAFAGKLDLGAKKAPAPAVPVPMPAPAPVTVPEPAPVQQDKTPINVWYGTGENAEFSNLAERPFEHGGRRYVSVEHAYQTLKSGAFDEETYKKPWTAGKKFRGKPADRSTNVSLMEDLVYQSFAQNPEAARRLVATGTRPFTHTQDAGVWAKEFPKILESVRDNLEESIKPGPTSAKVHVAFTTDNPHRKKDEDKFNKLGGLTKFIGFGPGSTGVYAETLAAIANKETYTADDIVGVSVNGDRPNRVPVRGTDVERLVRLACAAGATIIADKESDRTDYNIGERELADLLRELGYSDTDGDGVWRPKPKAPAEPKPVIREEDLTDKTVVESALQAAIRDNFSRIPDTEIREDLRTEMINTDTNPWEYRQRPGGSKFDYDHVLVEENGNVDHTAEMLAKALLGTATEAEYRVLGYDDTTPQVQRDRIAVILEAYGDANVRPRPAPEPVIRDEDPLTWRDDVAAAADRMRAVMKLWDCGDVVYTGGDSFKIVGKFHRVGIMSGNAAFDTEVIVTVEDAPSPVDGPADDAFVASALAKAGSPMSLPDFRKLPGAQQQALLAQWTESGRFVPGFTRGAHTAFSVTPEALGAVTGRITLYKTADGKFDPKSNSLFHEYFHSVMAMVRAVGGMTADDVKVLRDKYGEDPLMSGWFNEEKAADEFREFMEDSLEEAPELDEESKHLSVFGRILEHLRFLFDALFGFARSWSSADYAKDMEESPLAAIALTGRVRQSLPEKAVRMDFDGKLDSTVAQYLTQLDRWRGEASYLDSPPMESADPYSFMDFRRRSGGGNAAGLIARLEGTVNDFRRPVRAPLDPSDALDSDKNLKLGIDHSARPLYPWLSYSNGMYGTADELDLKYRGTRSNRKLVAELPGYAKTLDDVPWFKDHKAPKELLDEQEAAEDADAAAFRRGGTRPSRGAPLSMSKLAGAPFSGTVNGWTREELILNAYDRKRFPAGQVPVETAAAMSAVIDRMREIGREPDARRRLEMLDGLKGESPLTEDLVKAVGTALSKYGPSYGGALADAVAEGTVKPNWTFDSTIAYDIQAPVLNDAPVVADEAIRDDVAPVTPLVRRAVDAAVGPSLRMNRPYGRIHMVANAVGRALRTRFGDQASVDVLSKMTQARRDAVAPAVAEIALNAAAQAAHLYGADLSDERLRNLVFNGMVELYSGVDRMVAGDAPVAGSARTGDPTGRGRKAGMVGEAGPHGRTDQNTKTGASAFDLAAAVATSTGALPRDVAEAGLADLEQYYRKYGEGSAFRVNVLDRCRAALDAAAAADPTRLATDTGYLEEVVGSALSGLRAGLRDTDRGPDGEFGDYELARPSKTANRDAVGEPGADEGNIARYRDHVGNPDFQSVMKGTLSKLYTIAASMKFYRQIGMQPGRPEDSAAIRVLAPNAPEPLSVAATMNALGASEPRFGEPDFEAVDFYDQAWFSAMNPEAWLDSMVRPRFGGVDLRESQKGERDAAAGFRREESLLNSFQSRLFGMDVLPGTPLTKLSVVKGDSFRLVGGVARRVKAEDAGGAYGLTDAGGKPVRIKFEGYDRERTGAPLTVNAARENSLWMMAMRVKAAGGRHMLTGVDGITFSVNDSADEAHYAFNLVEARAKQGRAGGYSDFDRALLRLMRQWHDGVGKAVTKNVETVRTAYGSITTVTPEGKGPIGLPGADLVRRTQREDDWDGVTGESGMDMYNRLVKSACAALRRAKALVEATDPETGKREGGASGLFAADVNAYVLGAMERDGLVVTHDVKRRDGITAPQTAAVALDVDEIDRRWHDEGNEGYAALLAAGRERQWLTFEAYAKPQLELANRVKRFVDERPWLSDGDGAFFHNMTTPIPFIQGSGHFMYQANRRERLRSDSVSGAKGAFEDAFMQLMRENGDAKVSSVAGDSVAYLVRTLFHVREADAESVRSAMARGDYARLAGIPADPTVDDVLRRCYERLVGMEWAENGDPTVRALGGGAAVSRMAAGYERRRRDAEEAGGTVVTGGRGITDELMYKITGCLPANHQLGHAVSNMVDGILNAVAFRSSVFNMMTAPDGEGRPVCLMRPSDTAERDGGVTDAMWGAAARWWSELYGAPYDPGKTGTENARAVYDYVDARQGGDKESWGRLDPNDIDVPSISGVLARKWTPERESKLDWAAGGYALGYAKHLFQSTRALGGGAFRTFVHRAWAYSKALSVSFGYFFPIATRFESPIGAIGALATLGGIAAPEKTRQLADRYAKFRKALGANEGWITADFLGQGDVFGMMDSNDPFLADLAQLASSIGLTLSDPESNVLEQQRGVMVADAKKATEWVRRTRGAKAAKHVSDFFYALLERGGERAFTYHLNATKMCVAAQVAQKLRAEAARRGIAFDPVRDLKRYAGYLNAEIGGVDPLEYAWAHPKARNNLAALFFSWDWTRGAWEAGGGAAIEQLLFGGHRVTKEERGVYLGRWLRMGFWVMYGLPFVAQLACKVLAVAIDPDHEDRDDEPWFTWDNPSGERSSFDLTPLLRAVGKRFPRYAKFREAHPLLASAPMYGVMLAGGGFWKVGTSALLATPWHDPDKGGQRHEYGHLAKQAHEFFAWFDDPPKAMFGKMARLPQSLAENTMIHLGYRPPWRTEEDAGTLGGLVRAFLPFSLGGYFDGRGAGGFAAFFPTRKGMSYAKIKDEAKRLLDRWASNDRRGAASGKRPNGKTPFSRYIGVNHVAVSELVREGVRNGLTEKVAFAAVAESVSELLTKRRGKLMDVMPAWPNEGYDAHAASRLIRECSRLGVKGKDLYKYYKRRLKEQNRWHETDLETRRRAKALIRLTTRTNPYAVTNAAVEENVERYDY